MALNPLFLNQCFDKNRLKNLITWSLLTVGERQTIETVENLKALGFQFATQAGVSLSVDDLKIPPEKLSLVSQASQQVEATQQAYQRGNLTAIEKLQQLVDTWHRTSETLKQTVVNHFQSTDKLSPVYMMAFSGARGNISQVRQLAGMRGLMADPQGQIIGFPIRSNFREGLTLTEYMISCYGARKGLVDTALRTADAGYLTRRLVDVSQHMIVKAATCATPRGIVLKDLQSSTKVVLPLRERLIGRVLAEDVVARKELLEVGKGSSAPSLSAGSGQKTSNVSSEGSNATIGASPEAGQPGLVACRNQEISAKLASRIASCRNAVIVRSPLTCSIRHGVCQLCYGWSLSEGRLVTLGEAVGIIAAQSIGEPGTQLTMRTFHTGGVFSGDVMAEVRAPHDGVVDFPQPLQGLLIRTSHGKIAFLTKAPGSLLLGSGRSLAMAEEETLFSLEPLTILFVRQHEKVARTQLIAEFSSMGTEMNETVEAKRILFSEMVGQVSFANVSLGTRRRESGDILQVSRNLGFVWILSGRRSPVTPLLGIYSKGSHLVNRKSLVARVASKQTWHANTLSIIDNEPYIAKQCMHPNSTQFRSKMPGVDQDTPPVFQSRGPIVFDERGERRAAQNGALASASRPCIPTGCMERQTVPRNAESLRGLVGPVMTPNPVGNCSNVTFSTALRFVPNLGYCSISLSATKESRNLIPHGNHLNVYSGLTWPRAERHREAATELPGRHPKELQASQASRGQASQGFGVSLNGPDPKPVPCIPTGCKDGFEGHPCIACDAEGGRKAPLSAAKPTRGRFHCQPRLATGRRVTPSATLSPDCLLFDSFPLLQSYQEGHLSAAAFAHKPSPVPFEAGPAFRRKGSKAILGQKGAKRLTGTGPTSMARPQRPYPLPSTPPLGERRDHNEPVPMAPDFYWLPGEQKSGQTGLAWVDSRYIGKSFAHGDVVWIDEQGLECRAIHSSQALQTSQASTGLAGLTGASLTGLTGAGLIGAGALGGPHPLLHCLAMQPQGRFAERGLAQARSVGRIGLTRAGFTLFDQETRCQPLAFKASTHGLKNGVSFSKEELLAVQEQHFSSIDRKRKDELTKTHTLATELGRQETMLFKGPINNVQFDFAARGTNPLVRNTAVGSQQNARSKKESQLELRGFYKAHEKDASQLTTRFVTTRSAADILPPHQETQLRAKDILKASQFPEGQTSQASQASQGLTGPTRPHVFRLQVKTGWVYCPHEQANLPRFHESIQFCDGSRLDNLFFEPTLAYLEAFKGGQFSYSIADSLLIASLRVQLLELRLSGRDAKERLGEAGRSPTIVTSGSLFHHLATQGIDTQIEPEESPAFLYTNTWASHVPVSNFHPVAEKDLQSFVENKPMSYALGQEILVLLRKTLWFSQAFAPPLTELDVGGSFLQTLLQKRAGGGDVTRHNQLNLRADLYQILFLRNLLNREPFLWLRAFPLQFQLVTNQKARHLGTASRLHNRPSQVTSAHIESLPHLNAGKEIQLVTASEKQTRQGKIQTHVTPRSELSKTKPHVTGGLLPLVQTKPLFPYGFALGLPTSYLSVSSQFKPLKEETRTRYTGVRRPPLHRFRCTRSKANEGAGHTGAGHTEAGHLHKLAADTWLYARRIVRASNSTGHQWRRGLSATSLRPQHSSIGDPQLVKSWFFEPALASPSLLVLIRKGHCYPLSMLEKSKAIFLRRHTLAKIFVSKKSTIPLTIGNSLAFCTKQLLTPLILDSPDIRFNVAPLVPFEGFQTAFLSNPLYWIRFAGSFSPSLYQNRARLQTGSSSKEAAGMSSFTSLRTRDGGSSAANTSKGAPPDGFSSRLNRLPRNFETAKKGILSPGTDGVATMVSPSAGEMVSQWGWGLGGKAPHPPTPRKSGEAARGLDSQHLGQQTKQHQATSQEGGNVLFTQADHASLAIEGWNSKTGVGEFVSIGDEIVSGYATPISGQVVAIEKDKITLRRTQALLFYAQGVMHVNHGEWVEKNAPILTLTYQKLITGDIVQGIPKIEQFFEAPATKEGEPLPNSLQARLRRSFQRLKQLHPVPQAVKRSLEEIQQILVEGILKVYLSQGVRIADKHLEIVIRQMTSKGQVLDVGNTGLFQGEHVRLDRIERINLATYGQKADYEPAVLGITQASLDSESFISAASFQETTRVLSRDTIIGKTDFLRGLKERVVLGDLIQAGTGVDDNINYGLLFGIAPTYDPGLAGAGLTGLTGAGARPQARSVGRVRRPPVRSKANEGVALLRNAEGGRKPP